MVGGFFFLNTNVSLNTENVSYFRLNCFFVEGFHLFLSCANINALLGDVYQVLIAFIKDLDFSFLEKFLRSI